MRNTNKIKVCGSVFYEATGDSLICRPYFTLQYVCECHVVRRDVSALSLVRRPVGKAAWTSCARRIRHIRLDFVHS
jgi:hypothetical protein